MAFTKSKKEKKVASVVVDRRGADDRDQTIARQAAALEKAWKERDAARDQATLLAGKVGRLEAQVAELSADLKEANSRG